MPDIEAVLEQCKYLIREGRGKEKGHLLLIDADQKKRNENKGPKPKTKFGLQTDSPEAYSELNKCKDFVIRKCGNKSVAITLLIWAWRQLDERTINKLLAAGEGPE